MRRTAAVMVTILAFCACAASAGTDIAVFNFQMKSDTPEWVWLEKGLADRITTDIAQGRMLTVVARDQMQLVAEKLKWTAEMSVKDEKQMNQIQSQLVVDRVVSGVYTVKGDDIEIVGQVIDVSTRKEVYRKEVSGKSADVLTLQRQLSVELQQLLTKSPAAEILPKMPVWTKSVPAARSLYQGVQLYDEGRYVDAWLSFRTASRADPAYQEASYWAGKMYYFMGRYQHAAAEMAPFTKITSDAPSPCVLDALRVYCGSVGAGEGDLGKRLAAVKEIRGICEKIRDREGWYSARASEEAYRDEAAWLLDALGRHHESFQMCGPPRFINGHTFDFEAIRNMMWHNMLTGETPTAKEIGAEIQYLNRDTQTFLVRGDGEKLVNACGVRILGSKYNRIDAQAEFQEAQTQRSAFLIAPSGYVFKSLQIKPDITGGRDGVMSATVFSLDNIQLCFGNTTSGLDQLGREGWLAGPLPRTGILMVRWSIRVRGADSEPITINAMQITARLEKIKDHGSVYVTCRQTSNFAVEVDGILTRFASGLIGPLNAGEHKLTLRPREKDSPFEPWTTTITVVAGKTTPVAGRLTIRDDSPLAKWDFACIDAPPVASAKAELGAVTGVIVDEDKVRLLWAQNKDLWTTVSTDGKSYSPPRRIGLPVSSTWDEWSPSCVRDETGRYLLLFWSNRAEKASLYMSWSRDFEHWSRPQVVPGVEGWGNKYNVCADTRGRMLMVVVNGANNPWDRAPFKLSIRVGADLADTSQVAMLQMPPASEFSRPVLIQRDDGRYEVFIVMLLKPEKLVNAPWDVTLLKSISSDGVKWSQLETIHTETVHTETFGKRTSLSGVHVGGKTTLAMQLSGQDGEQPRTVLFSEQADGSLLPSEPIRGVATRDIAIAKHPRWGAIMAWCDPSGYFVLRGADFDNVFKSQPTTMKGP